MGEPHGPRRGRGGLPPRLLRIRAREGGEGPAGATMSGSMPRAMVGVLPDHYVRRSLPANDRYERGWRCRGCLHRAEDHVCGIPGAPLERPGRCFASYPCKWPHGKRKLRYGRHSCYCSEYLSVSAVIGRGKRGGRSFGGEKEPRPPRPDNCICGHFVEEHYKIPSTPCLVPHCLCAGYC